MNLASEVSKRALARGVDVAEVRARSGSELSAKVRLGEPELIEEAGHRSIGMRVIKQKRVALTSTSDLSPRRDRPLHRRRHRAVRHLAGGQLRRARRSVALAARPTVELDLYDASIGELDAAEAVARAREGEAAARAVDPAHHQQRRCHLRAHLGLLRDGAVQRLHRRLPRLVRIALRRVGGRRRRRQEAARLLLPSGSSPTSNRPRLSARRRRDGRCESSARARSRRPRRRWCSIRTLPAGSSASSPAA